ncbi:MAG: pyruvate, phosphate dikinase/phosphoenolpyruvate synthase regulator [Desulfobacteraceae bacterium]|nr:pyruvate, phosphate dikinase/phosphoenolpyruvate synthase regulator [Desulfobacteraceae bacterium]MBC2718625.1 pyruvate, phosphate dikinase/phosphoenolpyruvate synthase regulator [Desulfobacteraceae bacterium]
MKTSKNVYYISDGTGILINNLGKALICQFPAINFNEEKFPFITTVAKSKKIMDDYILKHSAGRRPLIFSTIINPEIIAVFNVPEVEFFDAYAFFLERLETCLDAKALRLPGFSRKVTGVDIDRRVEAIHYCLEHDDGSKTSEYNMADAIIIGVSRAGKTPISVYMASQMGMKTANFPLTHRFLSEYYLPDGLLRNLKRSTGLTTTPEFLHNVRKKRYPGSNYAKLTTCKDEIKQAEQIFHKYHIPVISSAGKSIEEMATQITQELNLSKITFMSHIEL